MSETKREATRRYRGHATPDRLVEIALFFLKIGIVGFGGPLVHIAMMEDELVGEGSKGWTDEGIFMEGLAICNMLPGPASTQLGIFMGWVYAGIAGALVAGFCFMLPTFVIVVGFSYLYFAYRTLPSLEAFFYGINPVVIGLIVGASYSMARSALKEADDDIEFFIGSDEWVVDYKLLAILVGALVATIALNPNPVIEFVVAGVIAVGIYRPDWIRSHRRTVSVAGAVGVVLAVVSLLWNRISAWLGRSAGRALERSPLAGLFLALWANPWIKLFLFMVYTGSFIYGGGLVLIPFIEKYVVGEFGWMSGKVFVDGIAIGQLSPGPVVMTTAFIGYELMLDTYGSVPIAVLGAFVATVGAFGPSFVFIVGFFPYFARVRENRVVRTALVGVNAAVVGAILGATVTLARAGIVDAVTALLAVVTFVLFVRGVSAVYLILGGGGLGILVGYLVA
ncbi:chromate efflux transporter [Haladaptatus salinisoli]|uniref:chromate efflux transporter n=1 Tax=Haladaptatus salinisoli TaxID=2884876 RepID=UPI001D0B39F6|nr:chromate efflux transporter [Haladaptatus salinisoli]